ncbi:MAG: 4-hydroxybutyrate CoA-transferase [Flavobacteriales bacterium]|jgi:acyl-CoA hydrolase|nr:4-hydroxybutyrate CoA-transferase [Flavobacteriales bacterium]
MFDIQYTTADEAVKLVQSGDRVFIHTAAATPQLLVKALGDRKAELKNVEIVGAHTEGPLPFFDPKYPDAFDVNAFFVGGNLRPYVNQGKAHYIPLFLQEIPSLFRSGRMKLNVAMVTVSPPNKKGYCSLGVSVDISNAAIDTADIVIAQINPQMPRTIGNGVIHVDRIHAKVWVDEPVYEHNNPAPTEVDEKIGKHIAGLIDDGACLQLGIGSIPNAVLSNLGNHKNLGIHTEMFSDGIIPLVEKGVINGSEKVTDPGKIISGFVLGTKKIYDFIDDNPIVNLYDSAYTNDTRIIRMNPKATAINSAIEVDIFGQVCADSIGYRQYSGVGGQMDFIRGASLSEGGKPIIALPSITNKGISRIVGTLKPGASVVTTRAHVHYIVTEYGVAELYGKNLKKRAKALIEIAHPSVREQLDKEVFEALKCKVF